MVVVNGSYDYVLAMHIGMRCICGDFVDEANHKWVDIDYVADKITDCSNRSPNRHIDWNNLA